MANSDTPRGFSPVRHMSGGTIRPDSKTIASAYNTNIFRHDPVKLVAGGGIELCAAGNRMLGIFEGVEYTDARGNQVFSKYWPANTVATDIKAIVYTDPNIVFGVQQATGGTIAAADVGLMADHVAGTGSTITGQSGAELSGTVATSDASFRILGLLDLAGNAFGEHAMLEVSIWEHEYNRKGDEVTPGV